MDPHEKTDAAPARKGGFTLLELIAVIGIIAVMAVVVVGGFNGMMAATTRNSAAQTLERALHLARQEACVEGSDTYVYIVDIDRFAIVRRAGVITDVPAAGQTFNWTGNHNKNLSVEMSARRWIVDAYADLADRQPPLDDTNESDEAEARDILERRLKDYDGELVFDIENGAMARIKVPVAWNDGLDAWLFGIDNLPAPAQSSVGSFKKGDRYGWITHPVFSLPEGWVFEGSYNSKGEFTFPDVKVHFDGGGSIEQAVEFTVKNPSKNNWSFTIRVDDTGVNRIDRGG